MAISVVILDRGQWEMTKSCILRLEQLMQGEHEIIVVGELFSEEAKIWAGKQTNLSVLEKGIRVNSASAWNAGFREARHETVLFLYANMLPSENTIRKLRTALYATENIGAVGPLCNRSKYMLQRYVGKDELSSPEERDALSASLEKDDGVSEGILYGESFCLMVKREMLEMAGRFDERLGRWGYEDIDFSLRLLQLGYRTALVRTYVHGETVPEEQVGVDFSNPQNEQFFEKKWGFRPSYSTYPRVDLLGMTDFSGEGMEVLDIGCACGANLMRLRDRNPGIRAYGIEQNPFSAGIAAHFAEISSVDVETMQTADWEEKFDVIIMGDVIEHLKQPEKVLKKVHAMLKEHGILLTSIPNVLHISNVYAMLQGRWEYTDSGILDRTHLRFYTINSIKQMMESIPFQIKSVEYRRPPSMPQEYFSMMRKLLAMEETHVAEAEFLAIQWLIRAEKA